MEECGCVKSVFAFWCYGEYEQNRSSLRRDMREGGRYGWSMPENRKLTVYKEVSRHDISGAEQLVLGNKINEE